MAMTSLRRYATDATASLASMVWKWPLTCVLMRFVADESDLPALVSARDATLNAPSNLRRPDKFTISFPVRSRFPSLADCFAYFAVRGRWRWNGSVGQGVAMSIGTLDPLEM